MIELSVTPLCHDDRVDEQFVIEAVERVAAIDATAADSATCAAVLADLRRSRGWIDAVEARFTSRMRQLADTAGAPPAAAEHTRHGGVSAAEGRRKERRSKAIEQAPSFGGALADGTIGSEHVDALANATATLDDAIKTELLAGEADLLADAAEMTPEQFARRCNERVRRLERDHGIERNRQQRNNTYLRRKRNMGTGMTDGWFSFHPELANQIFRAIDREVDAMIAAGIQRGEAEFLSRTFDRNRLAAEALGALLAGGHQAVRPLQADISVICDHETLLTGHLHESSVCETSDGLPLPPASIARLLCEGRISPVVVDTNGVVLAVGREIRHANRHQRRALRAMYRTCAFHGCDTPFERCEMHHIVPWERGGPTDLENLLPLCSRHHHVVHEGGWHLDLGPDRSLTITRSDGTVHATTRPDVAAERSRERRRQPAA